jgi:hypothetical protein
MGDNSTFTNSTPSDGLCCFGDVPSHDTCANTLKDKSYLTPPLFIEVCVLFVNVELSPMASPAFEAGR